MVVKRCILLTTRVAKGTDKKSKKRPLAFSLCVDHTWGKKCGPNSVKIEGSDIKDI